MITALPDRRILLGLVLLLLVGGIYVTWRDPGGSARPGSRPEESEYTVPIEATAGDAPCEEAGSGKLTGVVLDASDFSPVAGAAVIVAAKPGQGSDERVEGDSVVTDASGRFAVEVAGVAPELRVRADGFVPCVTEAPLATEPIEILIERPGRVFGCLRAATDGRPLAGIMIRAEPGTDLGGYARCPEAVTDTEGRYAFEGLVPGEHAIYARGKGWVSRGLGEYTTRGANPLLVTVPPGGRLQLDLTAEPGRRIEGRALLADGRPAVGAAMLQWDSTQGGRHYKDYADAVCDEEGRFVLNGLIPGLSVWLTVSVQGQITHQVGPFRLKPEGVTEINFRFPPVRFIEVLVLDDATGAPVPDAEVNAGDYEQGNTGPDGRIRFGPLRRETFTVGVLHQDYRRTDAQSPAEEDDHLTVRLLRGLTIEGRVQLPAGAGAVPGTAEVQLFGEQIPTLLSVQAVGGAFRFASLAPGELRIRVSTESDAEGVWWTGRARAEAGDTSVVVTLEKRQGAVDPVRPEVIIRVTDSSDRPVPDAKVIVHANKNPGIDRTRGKIRFGRGTAALPEDAAEFSVEVYDARSLGGTPLPLGATWVGPFTWPVEEVEVVLLPECSVSGFIRTVGGRPLPGVQIFAQAPAPGFGWTDRPNHRAARSGADGAFRIGGLWEGDYWLPVIAPEGLTVPAHAPRATTGSTDALVELTPAASLDLVVLDWKEEPVQGGRVHLWTQKNEAGETGSYVDRGIPDQEGRVRLTGLDPARNHVVQLKPPDARDDLLQTNCPGHRVGTGTARYERAFSVTVSLTGAEGSDAVVWGRGRGWWTEGHSRKDGLHELGRFAQGPVQLLAIPKGLDPRDWGGSSVEVQAGSERVPLRYEPGRTLVVKVTGSRSADISDEGLLFIDKTEVIRSVRQKDEGYIFEHLPPNRTFVFFAGPISGNAYAQRAGIRADAMLIEIEAVPGGTIRGRVIDLAGDRRTNVTARGPGIRITEPVSSDGTFSVSGLPDVPVRLKALSMSISGYCESDEIEARPGDEVTLKLRPR